MLEVALSLLLAASLGIVAEADRLVSRCPSVPLLALGLAFALALVALVARVRRSLRHSSVSSLRIKG